MFRFPLCCRGRNVEKQYPAGELPWFESLTCVFPGYLNVEIPVHGLSGSHLCSCVSWVPQQLQRPYCLLLDLCRGERGGVLGTFCFLPS